MPPPDSLPPKPPPTPGPDDEAPAPAPSPDFDEPDPCDSGDFGRETVYFGEKRPICPVNPEDLKPLNRPLPFDSSSSEIRVIRPVPPAAPAAPAAPKDMRSTVKTVRLSAAATSTTNPPSFRSVSPADADSGQDVGGPPGLAIYRSLRRLTRRRKRLRRFFWSAYRRFRHRRLHLSIMALVIGACAGATALLLRTSAHYTVAGVRHLDQWATGRFGIDAGWLFRLAPVAGLVLTVVLVRYILRDPSPASVFGVLKAIKTHGYLRLRHIAASIGGCALTLGFGGSVGMEAPAIATGSTVGSNLAQVFQMTRGRRALLIACGAAGGIAAIFNAPLAGFLFAMEVLLGGMVVESIVPVLLASVAGNVVGRLVRSDDAAIFSLQLTSDFAMGDLLAAAALGVFCGLTSVAFLWIFGRVRGWLAAAVRKVARRLPGAPRGLDDDSFDATRTAVFSRAVVAGLFLSLLVYFAPSLYGDGVRAMSHIQHGHTDLLMERSALSAYAHIPWMVVAYALLVPFCKALATSVTLAGGGVGGIFIPCLFMGCFGGWGFARAMNLVLGAGTLDEARYVMAGMAGMVAGVVHAPLTGIFLCIENSGGYSWLIPYIVTAAFAYLTHTHFQPYSIYSGGPEADEAAAHASRTIRPSMRY